jgi:hypothetical protein
MNAVTGPDEILSFFLLSFLQRGNHYFKEGRNKGCILDNT